MGTSVSTKTYDGTDSANVTTYGSLSNIAGSDDVTLNTSAGLAKFAQSNAGTQNVILSGLSLNGSSAANYSLSLPSLSAVINRKALSVTGTKPLTKAMMAQETLSLSLAPYQASLEVTIELDGSGLFASAQPGFNKAVSVNYILKNGQNGGLAANYSIQNERCFMPTLRGKQKRKQIALRQW